MVVEVMKLLTVVQFVRVGLSKLLSGEQFLERTSDILYGRADYLNPFKARCNERMVLDESGKYECFAISAGNAELAVQGDYFAPAGSALKVHSPTTSLLSALYFLQGNMRDAVYLNSEIDFVLVVTKNHPQCRVMYYNLEGLADLQVGPGSVLITDAHVDKRSHGWKVGASIKYKSPASFLFGGGEIEASADYSKSIERSLETAIGLNFEVPKGSTCTPHLVQYSILCDRVEANAVFSKDTTPIFTHHIPASKNPILLPFLKGKSPTFFETVAGCIDFTA